MSIFIVFEFLPKQCVTMFSVFLKVLRRTIRENCLAALQPSSSLQLNEM
jgi:hypothetical protein